jgi:hypothetical protein
MVKWFWFGTSRVLAGFTLLSLVFTEKWTRGWLTWFLAHWQEQVHALALKLSLHLPPFTERAWIAGAVFLGITVAGYFTDQSNPIRLAHGRGRVVIIVYLIAMLLSILIPMEGAPKWLDYGSIGLLVAGLGLWTLSSPRAAFMTLGAAGALVALNFGLNASGVLPPPIN